MLKVKARADVTPSKGVRGSCSRSASLIAPYHSATAWAEVGLQQARFEVDRLQLIVRLLGTRAGGAAGG